MKTGPLAKLLTGSELNMQDAVAHRSEQDGPNTFVQGNKQIDAAWTTSNIDISSECFLPFYFGIEDHRGIVMDVKSSSVLGASPKEIGTVHAQRLQCNKTSV